MSKATPRAKIKFCKFENALAMQVNLLAQKALGESYFSDWCFYSLRYKCFIRKSVCPELRFSGDDLIIGLGNASSYSNYEIIATVLCDPNKQIYKIFNALKDWAKNWEGWEGEQTIDPVLEEYEGGVVYIEV